MWGYTVTHLDLSAGVLELARRKARELGVELAELVQGNATDLGHFADQSFDTVLLMGPLYHLLEAREREQALHEARRVLRPGGPIFASQDET